MTSYVARCCIDRDVVKINNLNTKNEIIAGPVAASQAKRWLRRLISGGGSIARRRAAVQSCERVRGRTHERGACVRGSRSPPSSRRRFVRGRTRTRRKSDQALAECS